MTVDELSEQIHPDVERAMAQMDPVTRDTMLRAIATGAFRTAADDVIVTPEQSDTFVASMEGALDATTDDSAAERVSRVIATAALNAAIVSTAPDDAEVEWVTMEDDRVREAHVAMHGERVAIGEPFVVGGVPMLYPGQPVGPPELWMNCRCVPRVHAALVARAFDADKRKAMADRGTAMPDGSYPIANVEDLRNAIQAIGRAKDPDAVKRHIRRRAKALNAEHLIPESWTASGEPDDDVTSAGTSSPEMSHDLTAAPANTHDAPGWLTHPRETQRLRNYWTRGAGAAKIRWGTPGDLTRCERHLRKYVGPQWAWGTCQNLHHAALGFFNPESRGRRGGGEPDEIIDIIDAAFTAAADLEDTMMDLAPPAEWFADPALDGPTPLTITSDGRVLGHLATWGTCHVGISGECVTPPRSNTDYAHFRTGEIETRDGSLVAVGQITMDTGHAAKEAGPADTVAHYDNTGTGVADVVVGEDDYGIWVAGAMRPGVSEQQMYVLKATGALSGDWRRIGGNLELVAALAVNVPGFPIPRIAMAASGERTWSLTAAGVVAIDPNAVDPDRVAVAVIARLDQREADAARRVRAEALAHDINALRAEALTAAVG